MLTKRAVLGLVAGLCALPVWADDGLSLPMTVAEMQAGGGLIVDIRSPEEWADTGVIDGARLLTFTDAQSFIAALGPDLAGGRDLVLVCRSGRRSAAAAEALAPMIANRIISVEGGMSRLIEGGYTPVPPQ